MHAFVYTHTLRVWRTTKITRADAQRICMCSAGKNSKRWRVEEKDLDTGRASHYFCAATCDRILDLTHASTRAHSLAEEKSRRSSWTKTNGVAQGVTVREWHEKCRIVSENRGNIRGECSCENYSPYSARETSGICIETISLFGTGDA